MFVNHIFQVTNQQKLIDKIYIPIPIGTDICGVRVSSRSTSITFIGQATINGHIETVKTMLLYCTDPLKMIESRAMFGKDVNQNILNLALLSSRRSWFWWMLCTYPTQNMLMVFLPYIAPNLQSHSYKKIAQFICTLPITIQANKLKPSHFIFKDSNKTQFLGVNIKESNEADNIYYIDDIWIYIRHILFSNPLMSFISFFILFFIFSYLITTDPSLYYLKLILPEYIWNIVDYIVYEQ